MEYNKFIHIKGVRKNYTGFSLGEINFTVKNGEYFVLLGHSGAGKSMLFEIISGIKTPDAGQIFIDDIDVSKSPINKRNIGVVFQDYAIFPHKTVQKNIAYPLKRKYKSTEIDAKTKELANQLGILNLLNKFPSEISGGEIQRTVLARTLASEPKLLLLDEPLSALDVQLKTEIRQILRTINQNGLTTIHITHDYYEAVSLADRIAIMKDGKIIEIGTPNEIFNKPKSEFTAAFAGIKNFFEGRISESDTRNTKKFTLKNAHLSIWLASKFSDIHGFALIKGQDITLSNEMQISSSRNNLQGEITQIFAVQNGVEVTLNAGVELIALITETSLINLDLYKGKKIWATFKATAVDFIPAKK